MIGTTSTRQLIEPLSAVFDEKSTTKLPNDLYQLMLARQLPSDPPTVETLLSTAAFSILVGAPLNLSTIDFLSLTSSQMPTLALEALKDHLRWSVPTSIISTFSPSSSSLIKYSGSYVFQVLSQSTSLLINNAVLPFSSETYRHLRLSWRLLANNFQMNCYSKDSFGMGFSFTISWHINLTTSYFSTLYRVNMLIMPLPEFLNTELFNCSYTFSKHVWLSYLSNLYIMYLLINRICWVAELSWSMFSMMSCRLASQQCTIYSAIVIKNWVMWCFKIFSKKKMSLQVLFAQESILFRASHKYLPKSMTDISDVISSSCINIIQCPAELARCRKKMLIFSKNSLNMVMFGGSFRQTMSLYLNCPIGLDISQECSLKLLLMSSSVLNSYDQSIVQRGFMKMERQGSRGNSDSGSIQLIQVVSVRQHSLIIHMKYHLLVVCLLLLKCWCNAEADWVDPNELGTGLFLKSFFAGYLDVSDDIKFYYVYHPSENNPTKDPVVVWFGSGPGCSSLYSMLYSKGPFTINPNTTDFRFNQFNWNKEANVVFIEAPAGVGFSVGSGIPSDYLLAEESVKALVSFFKKFPDLKDQDLYYAGEGYAGVQIPWLANRTLEWNNAVFTPATMKIRLRGLFLGNPCTQPEQCYVPGFNLNSYKYLTNHYYYTRLQYEQFVNKCMAIEQPGCAQFKKQLDNFFSSTGVDRRNIYKKCLKQNTSDYPNIPCLDQIGAYHWFNDAQFRKATHVNISQSKKWTICNDDVQKMYFKDPRGSYFLYPSLIEARLRIWVYSGVLDANNPVTGTMKWIEELREHYGIATIKPWTPWFVNDVNGGDVWVLRGLNVLTVRSAGHLVFTDEPELGYYLYDSFLKDRALS